MLCSYYIVGYLKIIVLVLDIFLYLSMERVEIFLFEVIMDIITNIQIYYLFFCSKKLFEVTSALI